MERYSNFNLEAILVHTKYIIILQLLIFSAKDLLNWAPEPNYSELVIPSIHQISQGSEMLKN